MSNFTEIMSRRAGDVERPPLPPHGTYEVVVKGQAKVDKVGDYERVSYTLVAEAATDDVDPEALEAYGKVSNVVAPLSFLFGDDETQNEQTLFRMKTFLIDHLQIEGGEDMEMKELVAKSTGNKCLAVINSRADKNDPDIEYINVKKTMPID